MSIQIRRTGQEQVGLVLSQRGVVRLNISSSLPRKNDQSTSTARIAAGIQPRGRALPQLIPDFMGLASHLEVAKLIRHLAALPPVLFPLAQYGIDHHHRDSHFDPTACRYVSCPTFARISNHGRSRRATSASSEANVGSPASRWTIAQCSMHARNLVHQWECGLVSVHRLRCVTRSHSGSS